MAEWILGGGLYHDDRDYNGEDRNGKRMWFQDGFSIVKYG